MVSNFKKKIKKKDTLSGAKKLAWAAFSKYIRLRDGGQCFTCGIRKPVKEMQAGHYWPRHIIMLFLHEQNVHCQCYGCNIMKKGNSAVYAQKLVKTYGPGILDELEELSTKLTNYDVNHWKEQERIYKEKCEKLEQQALQSQR